MEDDNSNILRLSLLFIAIALFLSTKNANAAVIVADHFDMPNEFTITDMAHAPGITSTDPRGSTWDCIGSHFPVSVTTQASFHESGRGMRLEIGDLGKLPSAQGVEVCGYPDINWEGRSQFIAYRHKISDNVNWGTNGQILKMLRFNMEDNDVIPELYNRHLQVFIGTTNAFENIYTPDNNWHTYFWEFTAQSDPLKSDGVIRLLIDGKLQWENTKVKWNSYGNIKNGTKFQYGQIQPYGWNFFYLQGNVSANYNGPNKYLYWDDFIISTTRAEAEAFISSNYAPTEITPIEPITITPPAVISKDPIVITPPAVTVPSAPLTTPIVAKQMTPTASVLKKLFAEDFEDSNLAARGWYDNANLAIADVAESDSKAANFHFLKGSSKPASGGSTRRLVADADKADELYVSYWEKTSGNWAGPSARRVYLLTDANDKWVGPASANLAGTIDSTGFNLRNDKGELLVKGDNPAPNDGNWHRIEALIKLNSFSNGKPVNDGSATYWVDGEKLAESKNLAIRSQDSRFNQLIIAPYLPAGAPDGQDYYLDNLEVWNGYPGSSKISAPVKPAVAVVQPSVSAVSSIVTANTSPDKSPVQTTTATNVNSSAVSLVQTAPRTTGYSSGGGGGGGVTQTSVSSSINAVDSAVNKRIVQLTPKNKKTMAVALFTQPSRKEAEAISLSPGGNLDGYISSLGMRKDVKAQLASMKTYAGPLASKQKGMATDKVYALNNFIVYGSQSTKALSRNARYGILSDYQAVFGKLPKTQAEWSDVLKMANGAKPGERKMAKEIAANQSFSKVYRRSARTAADKKAVDIIAYRLNPTRRNIKAETGAVKTFVSVFKRKPAGSADYSVVKAIAYSGAKR